MDLVEGLNKDMDIYLLFNTNLSDRIKIFEEYSMKMYMGGRQLSNRQEEVHERGGLKIKEWSNR